MRKSILNIIVLCVLICMCTIPSDSYANNNKKSKTEKEIQLNSKIALIYDRASGRIVFEKNGNKQTPMASTTKIMTAIIVLENTNLKDVVKVDAKSATIGGSRLGLKKDDKITVNDLLYGLMLRSGNDAASALAIYVGGSIQNFAELMNNKAKELGLVNTHFVVPHGLDNEGHYTTAYELAKITDYALENDSFKKIVSTSSTSININGIPKTITNTNKLLNSVSGVYGVKTGFTNGAGRCLVTACKKNNMDFITVIIGADTTAIRTEDTKKLIKYVEEKFELVNIKNIIEKEFEKWKKINSGRIFVEKGCENSAELLLKEMSFEKMIIRKEDTNNIDITTNVIYYLKAPVNKMQIIGTLNVIINNENIATLEIYNEKEIRKKGIEEYFMEFMQIIQKIRLI